MEQLSLDLDFEMGLCEYCQREFEWEDLTFGPDPYQSEINNDDTDHLLCRECIEASADEI
jgi:hypothetical protein